MITLRSIGLYLAFIFCLFSSLHAQVIVSADNEELVLSEAVAFTKVDRDFDIQKNDIQALNFKKNENKSLSLGYNNNQIILKFDLQNNLDHEIERYIYLNSINGHLKLYFLSDENKVEFLSEGGTDLPKLKRENLGIYSALKLILPAEKTRRYFLTITSRHNINSHLILSTSAKLEQSEDKKTSFLSFYAGGILLLVIYNFLFFYS